MSRRPPKAPPFRCGKGPGLDRMVIHDKVRGDHPEIREIRARADARERGERCPICGACPMLRACTMPTEPCDGCGREVNDCTPHRCEFLP